MWLQRLWFRPMGIIIKINNEKKIIIDKYNDKLYEYYNKFIDIRNKFKSISKKNQDIPM